MTFDQTQFVKNIQAAAAASPDLQKQLLAAQTFEQTAALLTQALGTPVSPVDLQNLSAAVEAEMTDEQLEAVAAGGKGLPFHIVGSIVSAGIACAAISAIVEVTASEGGGCKRWFQS